MRNDYIARNYDGGGGLQGQFLSSSITEVPAPLPILGLPAILFYSRKIKKWIKQRSILPVAS